MIFGHSARLISMKRITIAALVAIGAISASAFTAREVTVANHTDGVQLAGTLTLPDNKAKPRAALVLATGSGAQDRDETVFSHKPFKVIAETLADRGYAVLRMDDRGVGASTGDRSTVTTASNVRDVEAGLAWLDSAFTGVPAGVLGHSEGGQIAMRIGAENPKCRFIISLAGPAWRGDSIVMSQSRAIATAVTGRWDAEDRQRALLKTAASTMPDYVARPMMIAEISKELGEAASLPQVQEQISQQIDAMLSPWYREFLRYDPAADIRAVKVPWLALNGEKDLQVLPANLTTIKQLCPAATVVELPGHNHLFQHATTGLMNEYATLPESISEETLKAILDWLGEQKLQ